MTGIPELALALRGYAIPQILASAIRRGFPDYIVAEPRSLSDLAIGSKTSVPHVRAIVEVLAHLGLVTRTDDDRFRGTAAMELLATGGAMRGLALMSSDSYYYSWSELDHALDTGTSAFEHSVGRPFWSYVGENQEIAEQFATTMAVNSRSVFESLFQICAFPQAGHIVDIGAGDGTLITEILRRHPVLTGTAFDLAAMTPHIETTVAGSGSADRCAVLSGDMFAGIPLGGDVYLLKSVLHNWPDDRVSALLATVFDGMRPGARVVVVERALPDTYDLNSAIATLTMLVLFGASDRSGTEYERLLAAAGFVELGMRSMNGVVVIEGAKPDAAVGDRRLTGSVDG